MDLTEKQKEIIDKLKAYIDENGYSPTFRELAKLANINSSATISYHLVRLKNMGYIDYVPKRNRTIRIVKEWE